MNDLNKSIDLWQGTGMMLSIVLGAGLLTLPGLAAQSAGSGAFVVWLACTVSSLPLLAVFAIVGRAYPDAGGIAAVMKEAFSQFGYAPATFLFLGAVGVGLPSIALVGGHYAAASFNISAHLAAIALIVGATAVNLLSSRIANKLSAGLASAVIVVLILLTISGWQATQPSWRHVSAVAIPERSVFGAAFMMVFFAFTGWEVAANLAGEFRNPKRDFPLAMAMSFTVAVTLYFLLAVIVAAGGPDAANEAPFYAILMIHYGALAAQFVSVVAIVLIFANLSAAIWAVSRMVYSAATEGLITSRVAGTSYGVPSHAVIITAVVLILVTLLSYTAVVDLGHLLSIAGLNFLLLYAGTAAALAKLSTRWSHRVLSGGSILIVLILAFGRGAEHLIYPASLICLGAFAAIRSLSAAPKCPGIKSDDEAKTTTQIPWSENLKRCEGRSRALERIQ